MNKIIEKLLRTQFPGVDTFNLMEIVNATPNAIVATEILCGIYEEPLIPKSAIDNDIQRSFISYNKWSNEVFYSYMEPVKKHGYFTEDDILEVTLENWDSFNSSYSGNKKALSIPTGEFKERTSTMSLEAWLQKAETGD